MDRPGNQTGTPLSCEETLCISLEFLARSDRYNSSFRKINSRFERKLHHGVQKAQNFFARCARAVEMSSDKTGGARARGLEGQKVGKNSYGISAKSAGFESFEALCVALLSFRSGATVTDRY